MKAISPMIAIILLIAFVVAIGGLIAVWFSGLTSSQTVTVETGASSLTKCATSTLEVISVRFPAGATSNITQALVNVTIRSGGTENLKNITISVSGSDGRSQNSIKYFNSTGDEFSSGSSFSASINVTNNVTLPPALVTVSGVCQNERTIIGECASGQTFCMKPT